MTAKIIRGKFSQLAWVEGDRKKVLALRDELDEMLTWYEDLERYEATACTLVESDPAS